MRILVATDGSRGATAAVRFAARLAARDPDAELVLLTIDVRKTGTGRRVPTPSSAVDVLSDAAGEVRALGVSERCRHLSLRTRREIPEAISALADRIRADLVVVGSEGRDTLDEWVVGGVALRLIYAAKRPVVVVRPTRRRRAV
jgi:nucleotide-binding universal stress UspA family protein